MLFAIIVAFSTVTHSMFKNQHRKCDAVNMMTSLDRVELWRYLMISRIPSINLNSTSPASVLTTVSKQIRYLLKTTLRLNHIIFLRGKTRVLLKFTRGLKFNNPKWFVKLSKNFTRQHCCGKRKRFFQ